MGHISAVFVSCIMLDSPILAAIWNVSVFCYMHGVKIRKISDQIQSTQVWGILLMLYSGEVYENFDTLNNNLIPFSSVCTNMDTQHIMQVLNF
jgi:hypothetical protein